jgi:hypothetical protein
MLFWQSAAKRKCSVGSEENGLTWMMVETANSIDVDSFLNKTILVLYVHQMQSLLYLCIFNYPISTMSSVIYSIYLAVMVCIWCERY